MCELGSTGSVTATNTYGHVGLVSRRVSNTSTFYTFDPQGSVAQRLNSSSGIVSSDTGDAFGSRATTGSGDVFGYVGQLGYYSDSETGLCLCQHRYYDPTTGRFVNRDPMGYGGINLYNYCQNNSMNAVDPSGFMDIAQFIAGVTEGVISCGFLILGDTVGRGAQQSVCADIGACLGAAVITGLCFAAPEFALTPVGECVFNIAGTIASDVATTLCQKGSEGLCDLFSPCSLRNEAIQAGLACYEGGVTSGIKGIQQEVAAQVFDAVFDAISSALGGAGDQECSGS